MHAIVNYVGKAIRNQTTAQLIAQGDGEIPANMLKKCEHIMRRHGNDVDLNSGKVSVEGRRVLLQLCSREKFIPKMVILEV